MNLLTDTWEYHRFSCPKRSTIGSFLLQTPDDSRQRCVYFHLSILGCRFCRANLEDLQSETAEHAQQFQARIMESTIGLLHRPSDRFFPWDPFQKNSSAGTLILGLGVFLPWLVNAHVGKGSGIVRITDRWLIRRFNTGDRRALRRIYEKYRPDLLSVARALLTNSSAAEDVLHDVVIGFASQAGRFELKGSLKGYLAICVANRARNVNRQSHWPDPPRGARRHRSQSGSAYQLASDAEQCQIVTSAMEQLSEEQREVIALHVLGAMRFREIAVQKGESINTIQSRYRYGIKKLRSLLNGQVDL